jgi:hypothetical protein
MLEPCSKIDFPRNDKAKTGFEKVFIKDLSTLSSFPRSLSPCRRKTSLLHDATSTMLHRREGVKFPSEVIIGIHAK